VHVIHPQRGAAPTGNVQIERFGTSSPIVATDNAARVHNDEVEQYSLLPPPAIHRDGPAPENSRPFSWADFPTAVSSGNHDSNQAVCPGPSMHACFTN